ncbi:hypothetical protein [Paraburkholderia sp. J41]|uniref:hypothetical protein n=1 Tax=Paraburkholderia sp. J41 TaxID=2805433 RepID=UPI002AC364EE|nr:hypothetical protein [Paraburkholderia sp. J41]
MTTITITTTVIAMTGRSCIARIESRPGFHRSKRSVRSSAAEMATGATNDEWKTTNGKTALFQAPFFRAACTAPQKRAGEKKPARGGCQLKAAIF